MLRPFKSLHFWMIFLLCSTVHGQPGLGSIPFACSVPATGSPLSFKLLDDVQRLTGWFDPLKNHKLMNCGIPENSADMRAYKNMHQEKEPVAMDPETRKITQPALLVVHSDTFYGLDAKAGIDSLVSSFKEDNHPVFYMLEKPNPQSWYPSDRKPTVACVSDGGAHTFNVQTNELTITGGLFGACLGNALMMGAKSGFSNGETKMTVHLPMEAITLTNNAQFVTMASLLTSDSDRNAKLLRDLKEGQKNLWKKDGVHLKLYLDGKEIPDTEPVTANDKILELKFWSTNEAYKKRLK